MTDLNKFATKDELFAFLRENKAALVAEKKFEMKRADAIYFTAMPIRDEVADKAASGGQNPNKITVKAVINTTNLFDSHNDVHIKGIWKKTVKEQKLLYLLQEHKMQFDHIISDNVKASVEDVPWTVLGYPFDGTTEALMFKAEIEKERNPYMFEQYSKKYVKNHSVGMRYIALELAINSESEYDKEEKAIWDKYYPEIANKEHVDEKGYFWAVTEARLIEGSAVPMGSNYATPTLEVKETEQEPAVATPPDTGRQDDTATEIKNLFTKHLKL
jgi:hypothetical protein